MQQGHTRKHHPADTSWFHFLYFFSPHSTCTSASCLFLSTAIEYVQPVRVCSVVHNGHQATSLAVIEF